MRLLTLYDELLESYGHQHWWPADTPYEVVVGALLTQNTNWKNVEKAISNLKEAGALSPQKISAMDRRTLERLIRPSGFYRQKAERLKPLTARYMEIVSGRRALSREEFLLVKGVGPETADSIMLYAFSKPHFVIDAYTRRFCAHHNLGHFRDYSGYKTLFESNLPRSVPLYKEYHALIVEWGKRNKDAGRADVPRR